MKARFDVKTVNTEGKKNLFKTIGNRESLKTAEQKVGTMRSTLWKDSFNSTEYNYHILPCIMSTCLPRFLRGK